MSRLVSMTEMLKKAKEHQQLRMDPSGITSCCRKQFTNYLRGF